MEPGEDDEATLRRELHEELGLADVEIGPQIWDRLHIIPFLDGRWDGQHDACLPVRTAAFEPAPTLSWEQLRAERVHEMRWWTADEIAAARRASGSPHAACPSCIAAARRRPAGRPADRHRRSDPASRPSRPQERRWRHARHSVGGEAERLDVDALVVAVEAAAELGRRRASG